MQYYRDTVQILSSVFQAHSGVSTVSYGPDWEITEDASHSFPLIHIVRKQVEQIDNSYYRNSFDIIALSQLELDLSNRLTVQSELLHILEACLWYLQFNYSDTILLEPNWVCEPIEFDHDAGCTGWICSITLKTSRDYDICLEPIHP